MSPNPQHDIRIGTLVDANGPDPVGYIRQILPHGFESFQLTFGSGIQNQNVQKLAEDILEVLEPVGAVVGALGVYGNPLLNGEKADATRQSWGSLIRNAHLFHTNVLIDYAVCF